MILYEYPFNERIRTYLRLEHLFRRLGDLVPADAALSHHYALVTIFEVMDVAARADLVKLLGGSMTSFIVDVSNHDYARGTLNWTSVRGAGIQAAIAKASEGDPSGYHYTDPTFVKAVTEARADGIRIMGGYHCLAHGDGASIDRQVAYLMGRLAAVGGFAKGWAMIDVEPFPELKSHGMAPKLSDVLAFEARWHEMTGGYPLAHYIPKWYWEAWGSPSLAAIKGPLVASNYPINARQAFASLYSHDGGDHGPGWAAYGGKTPSVWQFGSTDAVPGITGNCDCNAFKGTYDQFAAIVTKTPAPVVKPPSIPVFPGRTLKLATPHMHGNDVHEWQAQMLHRKWAITVDGDYGPGSEAICKQFQQEKHLTVDGQVGPITWKASWATPIT